jgi:pilus assembly protein CpaB
MERYRHLLLLGAALVAALFASVIAYRVLQRKAERSDVATETRQVAVAMVDLSPGIEITAEKVSATPFLAKSLPAESVFTSAAELSGRVVLSPIRTGEPIFRSRVSGPGAGGAGVSVLVPVGKRAMAVRVDKIIGVSGFIQPQNRVDVLVTLPSPKEKGDTVTKIVLENMLVLAAGTELEKRPGNEKPVPVDVITLEVTPVDAEKLTLAASQGRIQLALRNLKDSEVVRTPGSTVESLLDSYTLYEEEKEEARPKPPPRRAPKKPATARAAAPGAPAPAAPAAAAPAPATSPTAAPAQAQVTAPAPPPVPQHQVYVIRG